MIDLDKIRLVIVGGLKGALGAPVIRSNTVAPLPKLPFCSYTISDLLENSGGTWAQYEDGTDRIPAKQIWSITVNAEDYGSCTKLALTAHDFFSKSGVELLKKAGIVVENVGAIKARDTVLTVDYEYRQGFDVRLGVMNEMPNTKQGIDGVEINGKMLETGGD
jgi:hypothetical protein